MDMEEGREVKGGPGDVGRGVKGGRGDGGREGGEEGCADGRRKEGEGRMW